MTTEKRAEMLKAPAFSETKAFQTLRAEKPIDLKNRKKISRGVVFPAPFC